jgi:hypothetical protein
MTPPTASSSSASSVPTRLRNMVAVPFAKEYVKSRFGGELEGALANRLGEDARLEVVVGERADEPAGQRA